MIRFFLCAAALAVFLCAFAPAARALSCTEPELTPYAVQSAAAIFEGVVVGERRPDAGIKPGADRASYRHVTFTFQVSKAWKGVTDGETVAVKRNVYWGDYFQMGKAYLVFAEQRDNEGVLMSGLCGLTTDLEGAGKTRQWLAGTLAAHPDAAQE